MIGLKGYRIVKPLVSVITPSYNQGRFIEETIESVLSQDYDNIEYIIVDGGSTDNTAGIIKKYDGKLTYITEKDNGQSDAINKGFRMASGEIVAWLNSDDVYEPGCVSRAVEEFEKNSKLGLLYGEGYIIDEKSTKIRVFEHTQEFDYWKLVNFWDYIMQPTTFFKKCYLQQVGYLDEDLQYCMDWDLWIKLAAVSEVKYIPDLLACSREYGETKTSTGGDKRLREIISLLQKYSGKKRPLGVESYKASTFYTKHANSIWPIKKLAGLYLTYKHKYLKKLIPQVYENGWIGKKYMLIVPGEVQQVIVRVSSPLQDTIPQYICTYVNGVKVGEKNIYETGENEILINIKDSRFVNEVKIVCQNTARVKIGNKLRVSLKILNIFYEFTN